MLTEIPCQNSLCRMKADPAGYILLWMVGADANTTITATDPIDLASLVEKYGRFHWASIQLCSEATAIGTAVLSLEVSNDGAVWKVPASATVTGAGMTTDINITSVRWVRARITTAEGAAETCGIYITLTRAA